MITPAGRNDECGMMNDERRAVFNSSFIIHHSSFQINLARRTRLLHGGPDNHQRGWIRRASLQVAPLWACDRARTFKTYPARVPVCSAAMPPVRLRYSTPSKPSSRINSARRFWSGNLNTEAGGYSYAPREPLTQPPA